jgi:hypothetical protein
LDLPEVAYNAATWIPFKPGITTDLGSVIDDVRLMVDVTSLGGNYQVVDKFAGILLLLHNEEGWYIGEDEMFTDPLTYPNKITIYMDLDTDDVGSASSSVRVITPYASIDDGATRFEVPVKVGFTPTGTTTEPFLTYCFETPDEATITGATNADPGPIVISSDAHGFTDNMIVTIAGVEGNTNANGDWVVTNAEPNSFELYSTAGVAAVGNSNYTTGGTVVLKEFSRIREFVQLTTTNQALTPRAMNLVFIESRVA